MSNLINISNKVYKKEKLVRLLKDDVVVLSQAIWKLEIERDRKLEAVRLVWLMDI